MTSITTGATIVIPGDIAAGIQDTHYEISGDLVFDDDQDRAFVRATLVAAFGEITGSGCRAVFSDEWPATSYETTEVMR